MNRNTGLTALLTVEIAAVFVMGILTAFKWSDARKFADDNAALQERLTAVQERLTAVQKRNAELEEFYAGMTRSAQQFHDELEACQRAKGVEWRERMQAICAGYTAEVAP
jgi:F0F1-type ATP synthase membrane subunit b/b'